MIDKKTERENLIRLIEIREKDIAVVKEQIAAAEAQNAHLRRVLASMSAPSGTVGASSVEET